MLVVVGEAEERMEETEVDQLQFLFFFAAVISDEMR